MSNPYKTVKGWRALYKIRLKKSYTTEIPYLDLKGSPLEVINTFRQALTEWNNIFWVKWRPEAVDTLELMLDMSEFDDFHHWDDQYANCLAAFQAGRQIIDMELKDRVMAYLRKAGDYMWKRGVVRIIIPNP